MLSRSTSLQRSITHCRPRPGQQVAIVLFASVGLHTVGLHTVGLHTSGRHSGGRPVWGQDEFSYRLVSPLMSRFMAQFVGQLASKSSNQPAERLLGITLAWLTTANNSFKLAEISGQILDHMPMTSGQRWEKSALT